MVQPTIEVKGGGSGSYGYESVRPEDWAEIVGVREKVQGGPYGCRPCGYRGT